MGVRENIIKLRKLYDLTQDELAKIACVTRGAVSQWEGGFSEPRMGAVERMADYFGIYKSNIIEEGGMDRVDPTTRKASPAIPSNSIKAKPCKTAHAPLLGRVHAGEAQTPDILNERVPLPMDVYNNHHGCYFLQVEGNCMSKVYPEGCYILIDPHRQPTNGSIAVVSIDGADYVMRRLYRGANTLVLSPDSWDDSYEDIVIMDGDGHTVEFHGVVVWFQSASEME